MQSASHPHTYAEWSQLLSRFEEGDDTVLEVMERGTIAWSPGAAERFTTRAHKACSAFLQRTSHQLRRDIEGAQGRLELMEVALVATARRFGALRRFAAVSAFPDSLRGHLTRCVEESAAATQDALERSAREQGLAGDIVLAILRRNRLTSATARPEKQGSPAAAVARPSCRKVIL